MVLWSRLVRYVGQDGLIKYGEPSLENEDADDIASLAKNGKLEVRICSGSNALSAQPTDAVEKVQTLLGPLSPSEVPIIRCIGLNYKTHSKFDRFSGHDRVDRHEFWKQVDPCHHGQQFSQNLPHLSRITERTFLFP